MKPINKILKKAKQIDRFECNECKENWKLLNSDGAPLVLTRKMLLKMKCPTCMSRDYVVVIKKSETIN